MENCKRYLSSQECRTYMLDVKIWRPPQWVIIECLGRLCVKSGPISTNSIYDMHQQLHCLYLNGNLDRIEVLKIQNPLRFFSFQCILRYLILSWSNLISKVSIFINYSITTTFYSHSWEVTFCIYLLAHHVSSVLIYAYVMILRSYFFVHSWCIFWTNLHMVDFGCLHYVVSSHLVN